MNVRVTVAGSQPNIGRSLIRSKNGSPWLSPTCWLLVLLSLPTSIKYSRLPESPSYSLMSRCPKNTWLCSCWSPCISSSRCFFKSNCLNSTSMSPLSWLYKVGTHTSLWSWPFCVGFYWTSAVFTSWKPLVSLKSYRTYLDHFGGSLSTKKPLSTQLW